jgi:hypothetical protein
MTNKYGLGGVLPCDVTINVALYGAASFDGPSWIVNRSLVGSELLGLAAIERLTEGFPASAFTMMLKMEDPPCSWEAATDAVEGGQFVTAPICTQTENVAAADTCTGCSERTKNTVSSKSKVDLNMRPEGIRRLRLEGTSK